MSLLFKKKKRKKKNPKHFVYSTLESKCNQEFSTAAASLWMSEGQQYIQS